MKSLKAAPRALKSGREADEFGGAGGSPAMGENAARPTCSAARCRTSGKEAASGGAASSRAGRRRKKRCLQK